MPVINLCHVCKSFFIESAKCVEINFEDNGEFDKFWQLSSICQYFVQMSSRFEVSFHWDNPIRPSYIPPAPLDSLLKLV